MISGEQCRGSSSGGGEAPTLTAFRLAPGAVPPSPAPLSRAWMENSGRFAYRCLPLLIANQTGWMLRSPCRVTVTWSGDASLESVTVELRGHEHLAYTPAVSHFGNGILTWVIPFLFRTSPGYNLLVRGPSNLPKDGISPLEGIVETDWFAATFTMNWAITRPRHQIVFEAEEPICMIVPQRRCELESIAVTTAPIESEPELSEEYEQWLASRREFLSELKDPSSAAASAGWQRHYLHGVDLAGRRFPEHQVRRRLRSFGGEE